MLFQFIPIDKTSEIMSNLFIEFSFLIHEIKEKTNGLKQCLKQEIMLPSRVMECLGHKIINSSKMSRSAYTKITTIFMQMSIRFPNHK